MNDIIGISKDGPLDQWGAKLASQSVSAPSESTGPAKGEGGATGSLPGLVGDILSGFETAMARAKAERDSRKYNDSVRHYMNGRVDALYYASAQTRLILWTVSLDQRQPEENVPDQPRSP